MPWPSTVDKFFRRAQSLSRLLGREAHIEGYGSTEPGEVEQHRLRPWRGSDVSLIYLLPTVEKADALVVDWPWVVEWHDDGVMSEFGFGTDGLRAYKKYAERVGVAILKEAT